LVSDGKYSSSFCSSIQIRILAKIFRAMAKRFDVYGIGNALVDIVTEVNLDFFVKNQVEKGLMTLVDEKRQDQLMKVIDMKKAKWLVADRPLIP